MIDFGTEATSQRVGNAEITSIKKFHNSEPTNSLKHYKVRVKVSSSKHEMTEFINFTKELSDLRVTNKLVIDREDPTTRPAFIFDYPKDSKDGAHFIIKCFTIQG
jgi:hypothetical protein